MTEATTQLTDRLLRFADLTLAGGAIPLPVSLVPSALPQEVTPEIVAPDTPSGQPAAIGPQPEQTAVPDDAPVADEAVLNSVNAALDAVRVSLQDAAPAQQLNVDAASLSDDVDAAPLSLVNSLDTMLSVSAAADTPDAPTAAPSVAVAAADAAAPSIAVPETVAQVLPQADPLVSTVGQVVGGVVETVEDVVEGVVHTVDAVVDGVVGNVLVPTLNGLGLDILNGLVPAPPQTASANDVSAPSHDAAVFDAIGIDTGAGDHDFAHTPHAPQHLVGSGLI